MNTRIATADITADENTEGRSSLLDRFARRAVRSRLENLEIGQITLAEGSEVATFGQPTDAFPETTVLRVHNPRFYSDIAFGGAIGAGEAYINGYWSSDDLTTLLRVLLQNRDVLERFQNSSWKAVGLEMEGGHYQRAINAAIIQGHIPRDMKISYAYYASDNPLISGQTLASGPMGAEGVTPTYLISKVILEKILAADES